MTDYSNPEEQPEENLPPEAIRFGSTVESAKAILTWMRQSDPATTVRLEMGDTVKLIVFTSGEGFVLSTGDYVTRAPYGFVRYNSDQWLSEFGPESEQALPEDAIDSLEPPVEEETTGEPVL